MKISAAYYDRDWFQETAFTAGLSGLCRFTHVPFCLLNACSSFHRLVEQCLGDEMFCQFAVVPGWYLQFAPHVCAMLDWIELVFSRHRGFQLKIKPRMCHFFQASLIFIRHVLSVKAYLPTQERLLKCRTGQYLRMQMNYIHFLTLHCTTRGWYLMLHTWLKVFIKWWVQPILKRRKIERRQQNTSK